MVAGTLLWRQIIRNKRWQLNDDELLSAAVHGGGRTQGRGLAPCIPERLLHLAQIYCKPCVILQLCLRGPAKCSELTELCDLFQ